MGFFDIFDDANAQFKKDVSKAWDELWDNDSDDDDDNDEDRSKSTGFVDDLLARLIIEGGKPLGGPPRGINLYEERKKQEKIQQLSNTIHKLRTGHVEKDCPPMPGTPVYCNLAVAFEHTGIYIGNNEIVHLSGDGNIEIVSPSEFVGRLDGDNPAISIYCASHKGKALGSSQIAERARSMVGSRRNYSFVFDNCHQFTCGCISGDFENPCNFFWMVEQEISDKMGSFTWAEWDY